MDDTIQPTAIPAVHSTPTVIGRLKNYITECIRVLKVTKKPNSMEFKTIVKVSALGISLIGLVGFLLFMLYYGLFGNQF
ncbi:protein translocase SEC61 complex subunit gamma [Candidatus Woesearchaeota archaeon]|nr:protein translocase SEC61 complex subunit gamma [Candidatus Woesearchaeota archaeon]